jgi:hypothetical protein
MYEIKNPPVDRLLPKERKTTPIYRSYDDLFDLVKDNPSKWIAMDLADATGSSHRAKQTSINLAGKRRGIPVTTSVQSGQLYVRSIA